MRRFSVGYVCARSQLRSRLLDGARDLTVVSVAAATVRGVKQVVKVRVLPSAAEAAGLEQTLRVCHAVIRRI